MNADVPGRDPVFVVGCQRSGTTWVQLLLARHPHVSTANETHMVDRFLGPAIRAWGELDDDSREVGLPTLCSGPEFLDTVRGLGRRILARVAGPDTRVVVEKTPDHALWGDELLELFPDARILHVVRDPRDVCSSLLAAGRDWGSHWAPRSAYEAANRWNRYVEAARGIRPRGDDRSLEVRYEDLHADPAAELGRMLDWLGLEHDGDLLARAAEATDISRLREGEGDGPWDLADEPDGFFRKGESGSWREDLRRSDARLVEHVCREHMDTYGYAPSTTSGRLGAPPPGLVLRRLREWIARPRP